MPFNVWTFLNESMNDVPLKLYYYEGSVQLPNADVFRNGLVIFTKKRSLRWGRG
jgi:hypothetical protein